MKTSFEMIKTIFEQSRRNEMPLANRMIKVGEEVGELSEAVNHHEGWLPHKTMKEPLIGEVADVIITALDVLREATDYAISDEELLDQLVRQLRTKSCKWETILSQ